MQAHSYSSWIGPCLGGGFPAIVGVWVGGGVVVVEGGWVKEDVDLVPVWTTIWSWGIDEWPCDDIDGMVDEDDDRTPLWDAASIFLASLWLGKGNSACGIPSFSLCALVSCWDGVRWEVTLSWERIDSPWDKEIPCNLWIKVCNSGGSEEEWSGLFGISVIFFIFFFSTSGLEMEDLECEREVEGDGEGV